MAGLLRCKINKAKLTFSLRKPCGGICIPEWRNLHSDVANMELSFGLAASASNRIDCCGQWLTSRSSVWGFCWRIRHAKTVVVGEGMKEWFYSCMRWERIAWEDHSVVVGLHVYHLELRLSSVQTRETILFYTSASNIILCTPTSWLMVTQSTTVENIHLQIFTWHRI